MRSGFISAVALYGPKADPVGGFLANVQALIAEHIGTSFRPYSLEQIHATLIALNGVPDPATGGIINEYYLEHTGTARRMDLPQAMRMLAAHFASPLRVRFGGWGRGQAVPFTSRGQHLFERAFSVQGNAFVLIGWPVASLTGAGRPLDRLRRDLNAANVLHRYHRTSADVDDDLYLVVGHHTGAPATALDRAVAAVRGRLGTGPFEWDIAVGDVKIVAADSHTLSPPHFVGGIPVEDRTLLGLMS